MLVWSLIAVVQGMSCAFPYACKSYGTHAQHKEGGRSPARRPRLSR